jgi:hypothetical protein
MSETKAMIVSVLSIDAWADGPESERGWTWNNWFKVGTCDLENLPESGPDQLAWFVSEGYVNAKALTECEIDDDQYNVVIRVIKTGEPLFAIAYGEIES